MLIRNLLIFAIISFLPLSAAAEPVAGLTQRDLMIGLVDGLGWSFGLPEQPEDNDYLKILSGERKERIEVETHLDPDSRVIVEEIFSFGTFSGEGWVRVPNRPTSFPIRFNLPLSGEYRIRARLFRDGHTLTIGGKNFRADGGDSLTDIDLGSAYLQAGRQEVILNVPSRGGIDFLELTALPAQKISPENGWDLDSPLSFDDLAVTAIQILGLHSTLPNAGEDLTLEAEDFPLSDRFRRSENRHFGAPSADKWISIGADPETLETGVDIPSTGVYDLTVRCVGKAEISGIINSQSFRVTPDRSFSSKKAGGVVLKQGENPLSFHIPPYCGIDQITLSPRASSPEDFRRLAGLPLTGKPSITQFNSFLQLLATYAVTR